MATLSGNKIKNTYQSLVKFSDNGNITTSAKQLTDGFGNNSPMFVSTTQVGIGVTPESGLNLHVFGDAKIGSNLTVIGNLVVEGSTTTVGTDTLTVKDPLIVLANNNTSTDAVDIGFYGKYHPSDTTLYSGLFREALTGKYRLFKGLEVEPTTTVNTSGTGYAVATLIANLEGNFIGGTISSTGANFSGNVVISGSGVPTLSIQNTTNNVQGIFYASSSEVVIGSNTNNTLKFLQNGGTALTIDTSKDATFVGGVTANSFIGNLTGDVTGGTISGTTGDFSGNVDIDGTLDVDDVISIEGSAFGRIEIGGASGGYIDLKAPNSDDYDFRIITSSGGNEITTATGDLIFNTAETLALTIDTSQDATFEGNIILSGTVDGRDISVDGAKLDGIEAGADVTDATNVLAAGAVMTTGNQSIAGEKTFSNDFTVTSDAVFNGNINLDDDERIRLGTSNAFQLYYDSTLESGQGGAIINSNRIFIETGFFQLNSRTGENMIKATSNGNVELYNNDSKKLETTNTGITVTGTVSATAFSGNITGGTGTFSGDLTVDTDTLFVDVSTDSVGIGLTNPSDYSADELVISVPDDSGMTLVSGTTDTAYITFADGTTAASQGGFISHDHNTDTLTVFSKAKVSIGILEAEVAYFTDVACYIDKSTTFGGNVGIGITPSASFSGLDVLQLGKGMSLFGNTNDDRATMAANLIVNTGTAFEYVMDGLAGRFSIEDGNMVWGTAGAGTAGSVATVDTKMTLLNNGNLGIGADSPTSIASGYTSVTTNGTNGGGLVMQVNGTATGYLYAESGALVLNNTSGVMQFYNAGSERMRIDSSGNVGIGDNSPQGKLEVNNRNTATGAALFIKGGEDDLSPIAGQYTGLAFGYGGGDIYNNAAILWEFTAQNATGKLHFAVNPNAGDGTANLSDSKMTILDSGNVGIGTNSPANKIQTKYSAVAIGNLTASNDASSTTNFNVNAGLLIEDSNGSNGLALGVSGQANDRKSWIQSGHPAPVYGANLGTISLNPLGGNVGIGTTNQTPEKFNVDGNIIMVGNSTNTGYDRYFKIYGNTQPVNNPNRWAGLAVYNNGGNNVNELAFFTGSGDSARTEKMRITAGGTVGNTGSTVLGGGAAEGVTGWNFAPGNGTIITSSDSDSNMYIGKVSGYSNDRFISFYVNGSLVGRITTNGSTTSYVTTSDYRAKENVVEMTGALDRVNQLKPKRFNFIADADTVDGFLAHEVQDIVPEAISGEKDGMRTEEYEVSPAVYEDVVHPEIEEELDEEGNVITEAKEEWTEKVLVSEKVMGTREMPDYQGIDQSKLVPLLVGAIQELKAEVDKLKQECKCKN